MTMDRAHHEALPILSGVAPIRLVVAPMRPVAAFRPAVVPMYLTAVLLRVVAPMHLAAVLLQTAVPMRPIVALLQAAVPMRPVVALLPMVVPKHQVAVFPPEALRHNCHRTLNRGRLLHHSCSSPKIKPHHKLRNISDQRRSMPRNWNNL